MCSTWKKTRSFPFCQIPPSFTFREEDSSKKIFFSERRLGNFSKFWNKTCSLCSPKQFIIGFKYRWFNKLKWWMWKLLGLKLTIGNAALFKLRNLKWKGFFKKNIAIFIFSEGAILLTRTQEWYFIRRHVRYFNERSGSRKSSVLFTFYWVPSPHKEEQKQLQNRDAVLSLFFISCCVTSMYVAFYNISITRTV